MALKKFMERAERESHVFFIIASGLSIRRAFYKKKYKWHVSKTVRDVTHV